MYKLISDKMPSIVIKDTTKKVIVTNDRRKCWIYLVFESSTDIGRAKQIVRCGETIIFCICEKRIRRNKFIKQISVEVQKPEYCLWEVPAMDPTNQVFVVEKRQTIVSIGEKNQLLKRSIPSLFHLCRLTILSASNERKLNPYFFLITAPLANLWWSIKLDPPHHFMHCKKGSQAKYYTKMCNCFYKDPVNKKNGHVNFSANMLQYLIHMPEKYPDFIPVPLD
jgi:hypothetical protein